MQITPSRTIQTLPPYAFAEVDKIVTQLQQQGITPIDFGVGDPSDPTPDFIIEALHQGAQTHQTTGYPSYIGSPAFRESAANWMKNRFGIELNPETEVSSTLGSKEAIFSFPQAFINPGDLVIIPSPGYPPMKTGTLFAGGQIYFTPITEENNFLLDFNSIPEEIAEQAKIIWINYPNSPTGTCAPREYYEELIAWARNYNIIIAADEGCYIDIYFEEKPISILEVAKEGIITFYSLSKRNNMTGYRVGFVAGDPEIIAIFRKLKTNIDSGTPNAIQEAAIAALNNESHAQEMRDLYQQKRDIMLNAFASIGLEIRPSQATFYLWQKVPAHMNSLEFCQKLLDPEVAIVATPGSWISNICQDGSNPGEGYVRFALVPTIEQCLEAAERIKKIKI